MQCEFGCQTMEKNELLSSDIIESTQSVEDDKRRFRMQAGIFLAFVGGTAAIFGFSRTLMTSRKQDQHLFETGTVETAKLLESGTRLASRALAWGTFYAFLGTGTFCYGVWRLSGATNMTEFRQKMGSFLPRISKNGPPSSRTDFDGLTDLMKYLSTWGKE